MSRNTPEFYPFDITHLGNCTNLWREIALDSQCIIGGFRVNLGDLRASIREDRHAMSTNVEFRYFLDSNFYVADPEQNPLDRDISDLFISGENTDVIFDPLVPFGLDWGELDGIARRQSSFRFVNMLDEIEIRLVLFANREMQRKLIDCLKEKQKEYMTRWVPFHTRIGEFWKTAQGVCLPKAEYLLPANSPVAMQISTNHFEMLDIVFLSSIDNKWSYLSYINKKYQLHQNLKQNLEALLETLCKTELAIDKQIANPIDTKLKVMQLLISEIPNYLDILLRRIDYRELNTPICQPFADALKELSQKTKDFEQDFLNMDDLKFRKALIAEFKTLVEYTATAWAQILDQYTATGNEKKAAVQGSRSDSSNAPSMDPFVSRSIIDDTRIPQLLEMLALEEEPESQPPKNTVSVDLSADTVLETISPTDPANWRVFAANDFESIDAALHVFLENGRASVSLLQDKLHYGYGRAMRIITKMEQMGIVSMPTGKNRVRSVLITETQWKEYVAADKDEVDDNIHVIPAEG